ncbi:MAG: class I SAM-dependent methyltransferase [Minicystis sp.]
MTSVYGPATYGDRIAGHYDDWYHPGAMPAAAAARFLADLARSGPALELGIGTGRLALPLREAGVPVHGIDASEEMIAKLRAKPGGADLPVTIGSFADFDLGQKFSLVFVAFNTFWALLTQEEQLSCLRAVSRHLTDDGLFVMEAFLPDVSRFDRGQRTQTNWIKTDTVMLETTRHDPVKQRVDTCYVLLEDGKPVQTFPVQLRYVYISELSLMAQMAGLTLRERWSDWGREPFGPTSAKHISVWGLAR